MLTSNLKIREKSNYHKYDKNYNNTSGKQNASAKGLRGTSALGLCLKYFIKTQYCKKIIKIIPKRIDTHDKNIILNKSIVIFMIISFWCYNC